MAEDLPRTIENPIAGERVTFLATAEETNGEYVRIKNETSAGAQGVVMHYHLAYTEAFEVLKGRLDMCVGSKENHLVLVEGESVFVPLNTAHRFWNSSTERLASGTSLATLAALTAILALIFLLVRLRSHLRRR